VIVELVTIGSELLRHGKADTNSDWLIERLQRAGLEVHVRSSVDDDVDRLSAVVAAAVARADAVLLTGGLGPTEDDRTRDALARALDTTLERDEQRERDLEGLYRRYGRKFGALEARQALRPLGAEWIDNPLGSAAGLWIEREGCWLAALPGVPGEMRAMFDADVLPRLARRAPGSLGRRTFKIAGRSEASVDRQLQELFEQPGLDVTVLGGADGLELHVRAEGADAVAVTRLLDEFERQARVSLGADLFGVDDERLAAVVGRLLVERGRCVATAESCTAGLLGARLTEVPGSSAWYRGGLIVYDDRLKQSLAGVAADTLQRHGAVSECVARELAAGARRRCEADIRGRQRGKTGGAGASGDLRERDVSPLGAAAHR